MRFSISSSKLADALSIATKALSGRTTNAILTGILIETGPKYIQLTCSDERITIITRVEAAVEEQGRGVAPGKLFNEIVRRMPDGEITVSMNERFQFRLNCLSSRTNLSGQDADLFPLPGVVEGEKKITLPQAMLKDMIAKTEFAIAAEDVREVLTGCFLDVRDGEAIMVSCDSFRLGMVRNTCADVTSSMSAIIPGRAVGDIGRLLKDEEDAFCTLSFEGNHLHINLVGTDIYVVLVEGEYIDYRRIMPTRFSTRVIADLESLRRCVDRAALIAREETTNLVRFHFQEGSLSIDSNSGVGDLHDEMEVEQEGQDITISFNVKYILDTVRNFDCEKIEMNFNSPLTPCIITPVGSRDYVHLVLPVRTQA